MQRVKAPLWEKKKDASIDEFEHATLNGLIRRNNASIAAILILFFSITLKLNYSFVQNYLTFPKKLSSLHSKALSLLAFNL